MAKMVLHRHIIRLRITAEENVNVIKLGSMYLSHIGAIQTVYTICSDGASLLLNFLAFIIYKEVPIRQLY